MAELLSGGVAMLMRFGVARAEEVQAAAGSEAKDLKG